MICSDQLDQVAIALSSAQSLIKGADKGNINPHFQSKYADLASVWEACRKPLTDNGLSIIQALGRNGDAVTCTTMLLHKSGQWIKTIFEMTAVQKTPQAIGSCATYLRRYSLQALVGVAPEDDDGNASGKTKVGVAPEDNDGNLASGKTKVVASVVAPQTNTNKFNATSAASQVVIFSASNESHVKGLKAFLEEKGHQKLIESLCKAMTNQPWNRVAILQAWSKINPESPDLKEGE